jgi:hypothetical protein
MAIKKGESLLKNESTRLRFSIWVIVANFVVGIIGMFVGADLTALGVFLSLSNAPLYVYVLGATFRPSKIPDQYYEQEHRGDGGIVNKEHDGDYSGRRDRDKDRDRDRDYNRTPKEDDYNIPTEMTADTEKPAPVKTVKKDVDEIG